MGRRLNLENTIALEVEAMSRKILIQCQSRNKLFVLCLTSNDIEIKEPQHTRSRYFRCPSKQSCVAYLINRELTDQGRGLRNILLVSLSGSLLSRSGARDLCSMIIETL